MTNPPAPRPDKPHQQSKSNWQLKILLGLIAGGILALILKTAGLL
jgi:hypothetical protein